jgi:hypothetical protein
MSFLDAEAQNAGTYTNPSQVRYSSNLALGTPGRQSVKRMRAIGEFQPTNSKVITLNLTTNSFLSPQESYLSFKVTNQGAAGIMMQGSAYSMFEAYYLRTPGGQIINGFDEFGKMMSVISDYTIPLTWRQSVLGSVSGYGSKAYVSGLSATGDAHVRTFDLKDGVAFEIPAGGHAVFCLALPGLLGVSRYLPLKFVSSPGLELQLTLAPFKNAVTSDAAVDYKVDSVAYVATLIDFDSAFEQSFLPILQQGVKIHSTTFNNHTRTVGTEDYDLVIPERAKSIKSIFVIQQPVANLNSNDTTMNRTDARERDGMTSYQFQVGNTWLNAQEISTLGHAPEALVEVLKAWGKTLHSTNDGGNIISWDNYAIDEAYRAAVGGDTAADLATYVADILDYDPIPKRCGKWCIGVDMETYTRASPQLESGINTADQALEIVCKVKRLGNRDQRVMAICLIDTIVQFNIDGTVQVMY